MDIRDSADQLCEDSLDFRGLEGTIRQKVVVKLVTCKICTSQSMARSERRGFACLDNTPTPAKRATRSQ